jgi:hypothetical protein
MQTSVTPQYLLKIGTQYYLRKRKLPSAARKKELGNGKNSPHRQTLPHKPQKNVKVNFQTIHQ